MLIEIIENGKAELLTLEDLYEDLYGDFDD